MASKAILYHAAARKLTARKVIYHARNSTTSKVTLYNDRGLTRADRVVRDTAGPYRSRDKIDTPYHSSKTRSPCHSRKIRSPCHSSTIHSPFRVSKTHSPCRLSKIRSPYHRRGQTRSPESSAQGP